MKHHLNGFANALPQKKAYQTNIVFLLEWGKCGPGVELDWIEIYLALLFVMMATPKISCLGQCVSTHYNTVYAKHSTGRAHNMIIRTGQWWERNWESVQDEFWKDTGGSVKRLVMWEWDGKGERCKQAPTQNICRITLETGWEGEGSGKWHEHVMKVGTTKPRKVVPRGLRK